MWIRPISYNTYVTIPPVLSLFHIYYHLFTLAFTTQLLTTHTYKGFFSSIYEDLRITITVQQRSFSHLSHISHNELNIFENNTWLRLVTIFAIFFFQSQTTLYIHFNWLLWSLSFPLSLRKHCYTNLYVCTGWEGNFYLFLRHCLLLGLLPVTSTAFGWPPAIPPWIWKRRQSKEGQETNNGQNCHVNAPFCLTHHCSGWLLFSSSAELLQLNPRGSFSYCRGNILWFQGLF